MNITKKLFASLMIPVMVLALPGCTSDKGKTETPSVTTYESVEETTASALEKENDAQNTPDESVTNENTAEGTDVKNGEIYVLFTSDVHCGIDKGFGYAGLRQVKDSLTKMGYEVILADEGDAIQGEPIGTITKGEPIIKMMNEVGYDVAIPGNHEFDYGVDHFLELAQKAEYKYISCNFNHNGELVFDPYVIKEVSGKKIAFVGVTTPQTLVSSTPAYFKDESGEYVYGFMQDQSGKKLYEAVQSAIDSAKAEGADLVYVMGHLGNEAECEPWTYADVIANTTGIDVFLDGHSHDKDQIVMKDKSGREVTRSAVGTKLGCIGYSRINSSGEVVETGIWTWDNKLSAPEMLGIDNDVRKTVDAENSALEEKLKEVVAYTGVELTISDPEVVDDKGKPIRIVRLAETNMGDLCADAYKDQSGADIAFVNGGGIRVNIGKGDITYGDIISVHPYGNMLCVIEVSGQQILDALEWGARMAPLENGGFLQVSGLTYEIDTTIDTPCEENENAEFVGVKGKRRVQNVLVGDKPIDANAKYTLAGHDYMLLNGGDGFTMFEGSEVLQDKVKLDNQVLIDYIVDTLGGEIGDEYSDPFGQGRIVITE